MKDLFEYILIALACPLVLPFIEAERKEVSREDKLIDLANAIESDDSGYWTNKRISSALRNI